MQLMLISFVMVKLSYDISLIKLHLVLIHKQHKTLLQKYSNRLSDFPLCLTPEQQKITSRWANHPIMICKTIVSVSRISNTTMTIILSFVSLLSDDEVISCSAAQGVKRSRSLLEWVSFWTETPIRWVAPHWIKTVYIYFETVFKI